MGRGQTRGEGAEGAGGLGTGAPRVAGGIDRESRGSGLPGVGGEGYTGRAVGGGGPGGRGADRGLAPRKGVTYVHYMKKKQR